MANLIFLNKNTQYRIAMTITVKKTMGVKK